MQIVECAQHHAALKILAEGLNRTIKRTACDRNRTKFGTKPLRNIDQNLQIQHVCDAKQSVWQSEAFGRGGSITEERRGLMVFNEMFSVHCAETLDHPLFPGGPASSSFLLSNSMNYKSCASKAWAWHADFSRGNEPHANVGKFRSASPTVRPHSSGKSEYVGPLMCVLLSCCKEGNIILATTGSRVRSSASRGSRLA